MRTGNKSCVLPGSVTAVSVESRAGTMPPPGPGPCPSHGLTPAVGVRYDSDVGRPRAGTEAPAGRRSRGAAALHATLAPAAAGTAAWRTTSVSV